MGERKAWVACGAAGIVASTVVALAPGCTTHQCDSSSYDYYGGEMVGPNKYVTSDLNEPWISYGGNVTVHVHFPPGIGRMPLQIDGLVGTSATPNGGQDFVGGDNLSSSAGQLAEEFFASGTGFSALNASCASYFARFVVWFPSVTFTLFGGMGGGGTAPAMTGTQLWTGVQEFGDTWTWDGSQWTNVNAASVPNQSVPAPRSGVTLATASGSPFFFGGHVAPAADAGPDQVDGTYDGAFWQWDGISWTQRFWACPGNPKICPPTCCPAGRAYAGFAAMPRQALEDGGATDQILMFGGTGGSTAPLGDTWIWDGNAWAVAAPAQSPPPRWGAAMASLNGKAILFGGTADGRTPLADTWIWDNTPPGSWTQLPAPATGPSARFLASATAFGNTVVLFGGTDGVQDLDDTWLWDGNAWTQAQVHGPSPRSNASSGVFNVPSAALLLFGGVSRTAARNPGESAALRDFWAWNGSAWNELPDLDDSFPPARGGAGAAGL